MLNIKKTIVNILERLSQPAIKAVNIGGSIPNSATAGWKDITCTITVPTGYELLPDQRPISLYASGDAKAYFTDRSAVSQSGNVISFRGYLYNPSEIATLTWYATILFKRVGNAPIDPEPSQPFIQVKSVDLGSHTINANSNLAINTYDACVQACPSGYTYVGIAGFTSNHGQVLCFSARPINNAYAMEFKNVSSAAVTTGPTVWALYCRNSGA